MHLTGVEGCASSALLLCRFVAPCALPVMPLQGNMLHAPNGTLTIPMQLQGLQASKRAVDDVRTLLPDQHQAFISAHLMHLAPKSLPVSLEPGTPEAPRAWRGPERPSRPGQGGSGAPPGGPPAAGARGAVGTPPRSGSTAPATASKKDRRGSPIQPRESVCLAVLKRVCSATEHLWQQLEGEPGAPSMPGATLLDAGMEGLAPPFVSWERDGLCLAVLEKEAGRRAWLAVCMRTLQDFRDGDPADHGDSCVAKVRYGRVGLPCPSNTALEWCGVLAAAPFLGNHHSQPGPETASDRYHTQIFNQYTTENQRPQGRGRAKKGQHGPSQQEVKEEMGAWQQSLGACDGEGAR